MVFGIGIDITDIPRYLKISAKHQGSFENRLFSPLEQDYWRSYGQADPENWAILFSAKEAMIKALGHSLQKVSYRFHDLQFFFQADQARIELSPSLSQGIFGEKTPRFWTSYSKSGACAIVAVLIEVD
jgi:phosphopantetheine--protein transferase-like protein